jgi:hypothetical protein
MEVRGGGEEDGGKRRMSGREGWMEIGAGEEDGGARRCRRARRMEV